jgi:hypothetical protein
MACTKAPTAPPYRRTRQKGGLMTNDTPSRLPEGHEPVGQLLRDLCELADQTAAQITDHAVDTQLERILKNAGRSDHPGPGPHQGTALDGRSPGSGSTRSHAAAP